MSDTPSNSGPCPANDDAPALEARDLVLSWDGTTPVVDGIDITVGAGEICCMVGKSGTGKTTILHALAGLVEPLSGSILLYGRDVTGAPGHISYMLQKDLLLPHLTVLDNTCLPLLIAAMPKAEAREKASALFSRFGLTGTENLWPSQLSGGMRQRAALLRTYLMGNDVLLLDEPFSALDALTRADLRAWFCGIAGELGLSALVITHDVDEAVSMADRIFVLAGQPAYGKPSTLTGEVLVARRKGEVGDFTLTDNYLAAKRQVMALL